MGKRPASLTPLRSDGAGQELAGCGGRESWWAGGTRLKKEGMGARVPSHLLSYSLLSSVVESPNANLTTVGRCCLGRAVMALVSG